jgi:hypothetical protein
VIDICDCDIFLDGKSDAAFLVEATEFFSIFILSILGASTAYIRDDIIWKEKKQATRPYILYAYI